MANKYKQLLEDTIVEAVPIAAVAARAIGSAGKGIARSIIGAKPTPAQARAAADASKKAGRTVSDKNRKTTSYKKYAKVSNTKTTRAVADKDWLNTTKRDDLARHDKQIIRNNKGTGGSNVVTSGNKTTNHTSNYNQVRKKDLQVYSVTKQGQAPVKDDDLDNPLVTNNAGSKQGTTDKGKAPKKTAVNEKFKAKAAKNESAHVNANKFKAKVEAKNGPSTAEPAHVNKPKPKGPSTAEPAHVNANKFKAKVQAKAGASDAKPAHVTKPSDTKSQGSNDSTNNIGSNIKSAANGVTNVILKHLSN